MQARTLSALERTRNRFGESSARAKLALLARLDRARMRSAREVARLHEALCFIRAYPDDARVLGRVERMLARFARRRDLRAHRDALENSGIAGTAIRYPFFWPTACWLARRWPRHLLLDRLDRDADTGIAKALPLLAGPAAALWLKGSRPSGFFALDRLRRRGVTDAVQFIRLVETMPGDSFTREAFYDAVEPVLELFPGSATPARTLAAHAAAPVKWQRAPLDRSRPDLRTEIRRPPRSVREVSRTEGERLIDLARAAMVTRSRDLDAFAYGDPRDVRIADDGGGLAFSLNGVVPGRRALVTATYGVLTLRNGVPIGYIQLDVTGRFADVSYNTFPTFRGGEAARVLARALAMTRHVFGSETFGIDSYQLGKGNDEGIESGAWWFYYKLGFRPRTPEAKRMARRELDRWRTDRSYRSSEATLCKLSEWGLFFDLEPSVRRNAPPLAEIGLRAARKALSPARAPFARMEKIAPDWRPLIETLPGIGRWTGRDLRALAQVLRAKTDGRESDYVRLFNAHPKLGRALLGRNY